jgi:hypothetical protein
MAFSDRLPMTFPPKRPVAETISVPGEAAARAACATWSVTFRVALGLSTSSFMWAALP